MESPRWNRTSGTLADVVLRLSFTVALAVASVVPKDARASTTAAPRRSASDTVLLFPTASNGDQAELLGAIADQTRAVELELLVLPPGTDPPLRRAIEATEQSVALGVFWLRLSEMKWEIRGRLR